MAHCESGQIQGGLGKTCNTRRAALPFVATRSRAERSQSIGIDTGTTEEFARRPEGISDLVLGGFGGDTPAFTGSTGGFRWILSALENPKGTKRQQLQNFRLSPRDKRN